MVDGGKYRALFEASGDVGFWIPSAWHSLPYIAHAGEYRGERNFQEHFRRAVRNLVRAISGPLPGNAPYIPNSLFRRCGAENSESEAVMLKEDVAELLRTMYEAVQNMTEYAFAKGKADGTNLLMQLASGDVSLNKFNEATIGHET